MHDLQRLFRIAAEQFPAMMYVVVGWPGADGIKGISLDQSLLPADLRYNDDNLIESWIDQGYEQPGVREREPRQFWLMRASTQNWNKAAALDTIRTLAAQVMPRLSGLCNDDSLFFPDPALFRIKEELCCWQDALSQWLCALYHFRRPAGDDVWYALPLEMRGRDFYYYCLGDVFLQSVLACEVMLGQCTFDEFVKIAQDRKQPTDTASIARESSDTHDSANAGKDTQAATDLAHGRDEPLEPKKLLLHCKRFEATYEGNLYPLSERQTEFLKGLIDGDDAWIPGKQLRSHCNERLDKVKGALPEPLQVLIESHTRKGYRLTVPTACAMDD